MKKSTLLIALLLLNFSLIFSQANSDNLLWENDIKSIDFSGTLAIGNNVFAYGTKGMYFYSSDKGVGWEQKKVENASSIIKLLNIDNKIIGFTASGQLLQSEDFGKTWQISKLENVELICFVDTYLSNIYIRTNKSINLYNNKLELISSYKNDALNDFSIYEIESDVSSISSWHNIIFHKNELYFYIANNPKLYKININKFLNNEIKIDTITPCDTCQTGNIGDLSKYNNTITFYLSRFNDKYESRDYKYNLDSNSISENSYDEKRKYSGKYFNLNGINYRFYDFAPYWISNYPTNYFKLGVDILNTSDSLTNKGNSDFIGVNRSPVISDVCQVSDSTFIAVSGYKFLIISNDKCKTWKVISSRGDLAQTKPDLISKNYRYFANNLTNISSSIDNGLTYKFIERDLNESELVKFYKNSQTKITAKYLDTNGTFIYLMTSNLSNYNNIAVSKDYGKTATYFKNNSVAYSTSDVINFSKIDNKLIYLFNYQTINKNYFIYCNFDLNMNITRRIVDSINIAKFVSFKNLNEGFMITAIRNPTPTKIEALTWNAKDSNWIRSKSLDLVYTDLKVFSYGKNKDSAIVCVINFNAGISNNKIYIY
ncbi:MAG: hypothetical protein NTW25_07650, partial [Candidatus Kapabacteria bacterium]|nr:hypothetical protein [Candidatus Kapabacteria bacterium]